MNWYTLSASSKYKNKKTFGFDSKKEAERYSALKIMERAKLITDLKCQVRFELIPKCGKNRPCYYIADFVYTDDKGNVIVEDAKGYRTEVYKLKKKLMMWRYGIDIYES